MTSAQMAPYALVTLRRLLLAAETCDVPLRCSRPLLAHEACEVKPD